MINDDRFQCQNTKTVFQFNYHRIVKFETHTFFNYTLIIVSNHHVMYLSAPCHKVQRSSNVHKPSRRNRRATFCTSKATLTADVLNNSYPMCKIKAYFATTNSQKYIIIYLFFSLLK